MVWNTIYVCILSTHRGANDASNGLLGLDAMDGRGENEGLQSDYIPPSAAL
jgi:hypothetical protein